MPKTKKIVTPYPKKANVPNRLHKKFSEETEEKFKNFASHSLHKPTVRHLKTTTDEEIVKAIFEHKGLMTFAADHLGITYTWIHKRISESLYLQEAMEYVREKRIDKAEDHLDKLVEKGNVTALIFFLKTIGKKRGYIEGEVKETPPESINMLENVFKQIKIRQEKENSESNQDG